MKLPANLPTEPSADPLASDATPADLAQWVALDLQAHRLPRQHPPAPVGMPGCSQAEREPADPGPPFSPRQADGLAPARPASPENHTGLHTLMRRAQALRRVLALDDPLAVPDEPVDPAGPRPAPL